MTPRRKENGAGECTLRPFTAELSSVVYLPRPVKLTICGLSVALSLMASVPVCVCFLSGAKVTASVQLLPAASVLPQVLLAMANGPVTAMPEMVADTLPEF